MKRRKGIYKRGEIYWICFADYTGKMQFESSGSKRHEDAEALYIKRKTEQREKKLGIRPVFEESSSRTFFELATEYIKDQAIQHPRSLKSFKWFTKILKEEFGDLPLQNFTAQRVKQFHNKNIQRGWSPSTCNRLLVILRHMMRNAVDWEWIGEEVLLRVKKDQLLKENERKECLQPKECKQLINACDDAIKAIVILALGTGMRKGEILDLTWDQVDMENGFITLAETKNKEPRKVPINGLLRSVLQDLPKNGWSYVFYGRTGNKFDETTLHRKFKKALEKAGLKRDFRFHDLRHTFGSRFQMEQGDLTATAAIMGHKSLKTTQKYVHPDDDHLKKLAKLSENWLTIT